MPDFFIHKSIDYFDIIKTDTPNTHAGVFYHVTSRTSRICYIVKTLRSNTVQMRGVVDAFRTKKDCLLERRYIARTNILNYFAGIPRN
jgi:hypothetical protein